MAEVAFIGSSTNKLLVSHSEYYGASYPAANAFDGVENTLRWVSLSSGFTDGTGVAVRSIYLEWDLGTARALISVAFKHYLDRCPPKTITVYGSDTGAFSGEEINLGSDTGALPADSSYGDWFDFNASQGTYLYYRIVFDVVYDTDAFERLDITEIKFVEEDAPVFDTSKVPEDQVLTLTIDADDIDSTLTNFPVRIKLSDASGNDDFDCADVFDKLGTNSKKIAIEVGDTGVQCSIEIEQWVIEAAFNDGTADASTIYSGYPAANAFDKNTGTRWSSEVGDTADSWVSYDLGSGNEKGIFSVSLKSYASRVDDFKIQGSNNNTDWDDLLTDTCPAADGTYTYNLTTTGVYRYYRLFTLTLHAGTANSIWELEGFAYYAQLWVKVPSISSSADTVLNLYYDETQSDNSVYVIDEFDLGINIITPSAGLYLEPDTSDYTSTTLSSDSGIIDGDRWAGQTGNEYWLAAYSYGLDLGSSKEVPILKLYVTHGTASAQTTYYGSTYGTFTVYKSTDNSTWTLVEEFIEPDIVDSEAYHCGIELELTTAQTARYFKVVNTGTNGIAIGAGGASARLQEIQAVLVTENNQTSSTWNSNFNVIHHMGQDPSGGDICIKDSTDNEHHGTPVGTMLSGDLVSAVIGDGLDLDGTDDYYTIDDHTDWDIGTGDFTVEISGNLDNITAGTLFALGSYADGIMAYLSAGTFYLYVSNSSTSRTLGISLNTDFELVIKRTSGSVSVFVDGTEVGTAATLSGSITSSSGWRVGYGFAGGANAFTNGIVDEFRVSDVARSDDWIAVTNLSNTDALITFSTAVIIYATFDAVSSITDIDLSINYFLSVSFDAVSDITDIDLGGATETVSVSFDAVSDITDIDLGGITETVSASFNAVSNIPNIDLVILTNLSASFDAVSNIPVVTLYFPVDSLFELLWGDSIVATFTEYYGDAPVVTAVFVEWYGDAPFPSARFVLPYGDARDASAIFELPWGEVSNPIATFELPYHINGGEVSALFEEPYALQTYNLVLITRELPYAILDGATTIASTIPTAVVNTGSGGTGVPGGGGGGTGSGGGTGTVTTVLNTLDYKSVSITASMGQFCISCDLELPNAEQYSWCQWQDEIVINLGGTEYTFFVDSRERTISNKAVSYSVGLLSPTAKLDAPYASTIIDPLESGASAQTLVEEMAAIEGITVDYQILDWIIPGYAIAINEETPLTVIKKVVNAVGAIVQTKPNGDMLIISKYPYAVPDWTGLTPTVSYSSLIDIKQLSESLDLREGYNAFQITNQGSSSESINLEVEDINGLTKYVKGYRVPFDDGPFSLETSGDPGITINLHQYPVEVQIPIVEEPDDPEWEVVEFIDWTGSTSLPIYAVIDYEWIIDDLGSVDVPASFQVSEDGTLAVIDTSAVPSESLLRIKYTTKYWRWTVSGPTDRPVQFYVPEIEEVS